MIRCRHLSASNAVHRAAVAVMELEAAALAAEVALHFWARSLRSCGRRGCSVRRGTRRWRQTGPWRHPFRRPPQQFHVQGCRPQTCRPAVLWGAPPVHGSRRSRVRAMGATAAPRARTPTPPSPPCRRRRRVCLTPTQPNLSGLQRRALFLQLAATRGSSGLSCGLALLIILRVPQRSPAARLSPMASLCGICMDAPRYVEAAAFHAAPVIEQ